MELSPRDCENPGRTMFRHVQWVNLGRATLQTNRVSRKRFSLTVRPKREGWAFSVSMSRPKCQIPK